MSLKSDDEHGQCEDHKIDEEIKSYGMLDVGIDCLSVHMDLFYGPWMNVSVDLPLDSLKHDLESCYLYSAAGRACTCTDYHKAEENVFGDGRPLVEVRSRKTCSRDDGRYLEE